MAGSIEHCVEKTGDGQWSYRGTGLLENMGDMAEAVEEMMFVILTLRNRWGGSLFVGGAIEEYHRCASVEMPWPQFFDAPRARDL